MRQHRNHLLGIWFGLFAMLMIHIGPLISATQVLLLDANTVFIESTPDSAMHHESAHAHAHAHDTTEHAHILLITMR